MRPEDKAALHAALGDIRAAGNAMDDVLESLRQDADGLREELDRIRAEQAGERADAEQERRAAEDAARRGEHGPAMREVQLRIDRKETSLPEVLSGQDQHWSAVEVRGQVHEAFRSSMAQLAAADPDAEAAFPSFDFSALAPTEDPDGRGPAPGAPPAWPHKGGTW
ncbi:hypothetical protein ACQP1U_05650 [Actinomycetota bacterium]